MPKSVYVGESVTFPFEGITIPLASGYKDYLGRIYGDYMKLPPMEQRVSHHSHAVVDMTRRLTDEEALALL
jgi:lipopolysaccharide cholinephosphotransferase